MPLNAPPRILLLLTVALALLSQCAGFLSAQTTPKPQKWVELEVGVRQAKESGKPLFVVFRCVR